MNDSTPIESTGETPEAYLEKGPDTIDPNSSADLLYATESDPAHPIHWTWYKKWTIIVTCCLFEVFVSMMSTSWLSVEYLIMERYPTINTQVATLGQSMFIVGNAVGPVFLGPLADIQGRRWVYVSSALTFALFMIGVALVRDYAGMVVLMFLSGAAASAGLVNVAGTVADMYGSNDNAGQPMSLFVACSAIGPSLGSPVGQWVADNTNMGLDWVFWLNVIIGGAFAVVLAILPETLPRLVIAKSLGASNRTAVEKARAKLLARRIDVSREIRFICTMTLRIMLTEPIVTFFGIYNGYAYGLLFLYLDGVFDVFVVNNGLSYIAADLTYLNLVVGAIALFLYMPMQTWLYKRDRLRHSGQGRPEARFLSLLVCVWLFPISLFWFAFTSNHVNYWSPIVAGAVLGFVNPLLYLSILNYLTDTYTNLACAAVAAFLIPSFLLAAVFAHIGIFMFANLSTTWAFAILAFVSLGLVLLLYTVYFFGPRLRSFSRLARNA